jgi:hypothetical protein
MVLKSLLLAAIGPTVIGLIAAGAVYPKMSGPKVGPTAKISRNAYRGYYDGHRTPT